MKDYSNERLLKGRHSINFSSRHLHDIPTSPLYLQIPPHNIIKVSRSYDQNNLNNLVFSEEVLIMVTMSDENIL
jgi:hypothetical protein